MAGDSAAPSLPRPSGRVFALAGLLSVAVTQPLLDLFGRNPTFFTAGDYQPRQIVAFGLVIALAPSLVAAAAVIASQGLSRRLGRVVYIAGLALAGALLGAVVARGVGANGSAIVVSVALLAAALVLVLSRTQPGRLLMQYLAIANVVFLGAFLLTSPTARLLDGAGAGIGIAEVPTPPGPVVMLVLDELPLVTLLDDEGQINAERFPRFAELAARTTWFRNASSGHPRTHLAVPALLTGTLPGEDSLPTHADHPNNVFTLLGGDLPVHSYEPITSLCPAEICGARTPQPLEQALRDAAVVFGHRALPAALRDGLPDIDAAWGGFVDGAPAPPSGNPFVPTDPYGRMLFLPGDEKIAPGQARVLDEHVRAIDSTPALHLVHVLFPHQRWLMAPNGTGLLEYPEWVEDADDPSYVASALVQRQLHTMQVGAADVAIGRLLDHLDRSGLWDDTTLIVTSDHGLDLTPPGLGRTITDEGVQELFRIPLFVHAPGQAAGAVVDDPAEAIDVVPTLIDLLDIDVEWELDGHSLLDGSERRSEAPRVGEDLDPLFDVLRRRAQDFPAGESWTALAAIGEHANLIGEAVEGLPRGVDSELAWAPDHAEEIGRIPTDRGLAPQLLTGVVHTPEGDRPPEVLIAVDGVLAGVAGDFVAQGGAWRFNAYLGPLLEAGEHEYTAYEIVAEDGRTMLRELG